MLGKQVLFRWIMVAIVFLSAVTWGYFIITENVPGELKLPVYGQRNDDSTYHKIVSFSLTDQDGREVTEENFENKIYVADFFFTTCPGICPIMSDQLVRVAEKYKDNDQVLLLSHTVKPEEDSVPVLKAYAKEHHADSSKWYFVTGPKHEINALAEKSYLVGGTEGVSDDEFVHTQFFALIVMEKRSRGFYDGTDSADVSKLLEDIDILLSER
jgi:protein SCO1/2